MNAISGDALLMLCEPRPLEAEALELALAEFPNFSVLKEHPASGLDAIDAVVTMRPDIVLAEYWLPDMEGAALVRMLRTKNKHCRIAIMAWVFGPREVHLSLQSGAVGFFPKSSGIDQVAASISFALKDEGPVLLGQAKAFARLKPRHEEPAEATWPSLQKLSRRQLEIIGLLAKDLGVRDIAKLLFITPDTVKVHLRNILSKTGMASQREVVAAAKRVGLVRS